MNREEIPGLGFCNNSNTPKLLFFLCCIRKNFNFGSKNYPIPPSVCTKIKKKKKRKETNKQTKEHPKLIVFCLLEALQCWKSWKFISMKHSIRIALLNPYGLIFFFVSLPNVSEFSIVTHRRGKAPHIWKPITEQWGALFFLTLPL